MNNVTQKTALTQTLKAEEKKVMTKIPAKSSKKPTPKTKHAKPAAVDKSVKKTVAPKKAEHNKTKQKTIRDSFTMPENEYRVLADLKKKCLAVGIAVKKSELLRAGMQSLSGMSQAELNKQLSKLDEIKIGRPVKK